MITPILLNQLRTVNFRPQSFKGNSNVPAATHQQKAEVFPYARTYNAVSPITTTVEKSRNSYSMFKAKLNSIFYDCTRDKTRNPARALGSIEFNDKKYNRGIDSVKHLKMKSGVQAKKFINDNDIISGRIILDNGTKSEGNRVLTRLKNAIKEDRIEVTEIGLFGVNTNTDYADNNKVNSILEEMNSKGKPCSKITNRKANGYHSIVAKVKLEDGFTGTLEIMGSEVSKLKDVEDILHSFKKNIPVDKKYDKLKEEYKLLSEDEQRDLKKYTKLAYISARADELFGKKSEGFVPLMEYNLPKTFDFNNIAKI
ncbi:hypothetical protein IKQ26_05510 [bacterium]|nr:hypothetical protein [bacterium]